MSPFAVFFLRQFFLGINREVEEAAKIDGRACSGSSEDHPALSGPADDAGDLTFSDLE
jgi:hypothetical protein